MSGGEVLQSLDGAEEGPDHVGGRASVAELQQGMRHQIGASAAPRVRPAARTEPQASVEAFPARPSGLEPAGFAVCGAQPGVGCSSVALLLAEALSGAGLAVHLFEVAVASRSGLAAVTSAELGIDGSGTWRRGTRGAVLVHRRADDRPFDPFGQRAPWRTAPVVAGLPTTVVDLGHGPWSAKTDQGICAGWAPLSVVLVGRATVPGVRALEQVLARLDGLPVRAVALVGPRRLPGSARASRGPRLIRMDEYQRIVRVPFDRRLEITGLSAAALPGNLRAAGTQLRHLLAQPEREPQQPARGEN